MSFTALTSDSQTAAGHTALLVIDMLSCWDFPDAEKLLPHAVRITPRIAALKARCRKAGVPVIYANDNRGRWRSHFAAVVDAAVATGGDAARIAQALMPDDDDYFVLKPQLSAFFGTPLDILLRHLKVHRLIMTGVSSDQCVMHSVADARMRGYDAAVPRDCVASQSVQRNNAVLQQLEESHKLATTPGARLRLLPPPRSHGKAG